MGKRGNDMSQLSKEEYEAAMAGESSSGGNGFVRASDDVLNGRRILRTGSKWKKAKAAAASSSASSSNPPSLGGTGTGAATAHAFSNFSFTKSSTSTSLTAPSIASKAQHTSNLGSSSSKPTFAMPSLPTYNSSNSNNTLSLSQSLLSSKTTSQQTLVMKSDNSKLAKGFKEFIAKQDIRMDWSLAMNRYIDTYNNMKGSKQPPSTTSTTSLISATPTTAGTTTPTFSFGAGTTSASASTSSGASNTPSKPLFPPSTNAPAPSLFSFGSASASGGSSTSTKPTFSFGNPAASSPAPAPPPSMGFGFAFGGKTESAGSAANTPTTSATPLEKSSEDSANKEEEDGISTQKSADNDWNEIFTTKAKVYHHRDKGTQFAKGDLRLQQFKADEKVKRMVMRDIAGKVSLNVAISVGMEYKKLREKATSGRVVARISFMGVREKDFGAETLSIVCKPEVQDELFGKLVEMST